MRLSIAHNTPPTRVDRARGMNRLAIHSVISSWKEEKNSRGREREEQGEERRTVYREVEKETERRTEKEGSGESEGKKED